jgi:hypothetical protein
MHRGVQGQGMYDRALGNGDHLGRFLLRLLRPTAPRPPEMGGEGSQAQMRSRAWWPQFKLPLPSSSARASAAAVGRWTGGRARRRQRVGVHGATSVAGGRARRGIGGGWARYPVAAGRAGWWPVAGSVGMRK